MSLTKNYTLTNQVNYAFGSEIDFPNKKLALVDNTNQTFNQPFTNDTGFTYDNTKAEFVAGGAQQKDTRPADATLYASFSVDEDSSWGDGLLNNTLLNGATWDNGTIDLTGGTGKRLNMPATGNFDDLSGGGAAGCIQFIYVPNYTGAPGVQGHILELDTPVGNNNAIMMRHYGPGVPDYISIDLRDSSGVSHNMFTSAKYFNAGQRYKFKLNFDFNGVSRFYIDDVQEASLNTSSWTRTNAGGTFKWGGDSGTGDFHLDDVVLFDTPQLVTESSYNNTIYVESKVELPQFSYPGVGAIQANTNYVTTESGAPREIWNDEYWNGAAWVASNGDYTQANDKADILANIGTKTVTDTIDIDVVFPASNTVQSNIDDLTITYTGQIYPTNNPTIEALETLGIEALFNFIETSTKIGNDEIEFILKKDGVDYYWDGAAWSTSSGYPQVNTAAEIQTNIAAFTTTGVTFSWTAHLHSDDGSTTPILDNVQVDYDFFGPPETVNLCIVWGYNYDSLGAVNQTPFSIQLIVDAKIYGTTSIIRNDAITVTPDSNGYWEIELVENINMGSFTQYYEFIFTDETYRKIVPNETDKKFTDLQDA